MRDRHTTRLTSHSPPCAQGSIEESETWCALDNDGSVFMDHTLATEAINAMNAASEAAYAERQAGHPIRPFFLMVGFVRPHGPWMVPTQDWVRVSGTVQASAHPAFNRARVGAAVHGFLDSRMEVPPTREGGLPGSDDPWSAQHTLVNATMQSALPLDVQRNARRAYWAAVSFVDEQVGRVLSHLRAIGSYDSTIVLLHSDNGYHLGEVRAYHATRRLASSHQAGASEPVHPNVAPYSFTHSVTPSCSNRASCLPQYGSWRGGTLAELGLRVPLIVRVPWKRASVGQRTQVLAELIDIYPTIASLAGAPPLETNIDGTDLSPVFDDASLAPHGVLKPAAFSQVPRCRANATFAAACTRSDWAAGHWINLMGYSVRTDRWRYTVWQPYDHGAADWSRPPVSSELYAHTGNPGARCLAEYDYCESVNLAEDPAHAGIQVQLLTLLHSHFVRLPSQEDRVAPPPLSPMPPRSPVAVSTCFGSDQYNDLSGSVMASSDAFCSCCLSFSSYCPRC